ncbi:cobalamin-binding protein [Ferrimonas balearica]|uniref:cobalamin-binding protein n=1 Tax=Ferrimonas balearica TaxID=44012 RepID=UPI001F211CC5|nr:cobalamin-binding protein [Ferrimonas balearica]MBY6096794.1 cobalamin-binding protein [Ferrimonas balearica]
MTHRKGYRWLLPLLALWGLLCSPARGQTPLRIVALSPVSVEMLYAIGAGEQIVATVEFSDYPESAKALPRIGRHDGLDLESLLAAAPDVVVLNKDHTAAPLLAQLTQLGLPLVDTSVSHIEAIPQRLVELGELTGHQAKANAEAQAFRQRYARLRADYAGAKPVRVFYQVFNHPLITSAQGWIDDVIALCGGQNVFAHLPNAFPQVSIEQVLVQQPDVILAPRVHGADLDPAGLWRDWPQLPAVANHQLYILDGDLLHRSGPRLLDGAVQICSALDQAREVTAP